MTNKNISICCFERCCLWFSILNCTIESLAAFCFAFNIFLCDAMPFRVHNSFNFAILLSAATKHKSRTRRTHLRNAMCTMYIQCYYILLCTWSKRKEQKHIHKRIKMVASCNAHNINDVHCVDERRQSKEERDRDRMPIADCLLCSKEKT